jgi:hypothetical protein
MIRRLLHGLAKWNALRRYRENLPRLLVERYGRERRYTPAQVLTTIKLHSFSERFAPYACAMFCSKRAYADVVASHAPRTDSSFQPLDNASIPLWAAISVQDWPTHEAVVTDMGHAHWDQYGHDFASGHIAHHASGFSDGRHVARAGTTVPIMAARVETPRTSQITGKVCDVPTPACEERHGFTG